MYLTLAAGVETVRQAAAELLRMGLDVNIHARLPRERTAVFSVFDVASDQEHLVARVAAQYGAEVFTGDLA